MTNWVVCEHCNQRQRATYLWLTCVFCGETLNDHPYFRRIVGQIDGHATEEVENEVFRAP